VFYYLFFILLVVLDAVFEGIDHKSTLEIVLPILALFHEDPLLRFVAVWCLSVWIDEFFSLVFGLDKLDLQQPATKSIGWLDGVFLFYAIFLTLVISMWSVNLKKTFTKTLSQHQCH